MVPVLRLSLCWHATGASFVIYLEIDTRSVISPMYIGILYFFIEYRNVFGDTMLFWRTKIGNRTTISGTKLGTCLLFLATRAEKNFALRQQRHTEICVNHTSSPTKQIHSQTLLRRNRLIP
jgi:hypothetical protein